MKRKRRKANLMPRLGPPENLRPAGAHETKKRYNRKRHKAALERYDEDGFARRSSRTLLRFAVEEVFEDLDRV